MTVRSRAVLSLSLALLLPCSALARDKPPRRAGKAAAATPVATGCKEPAGKDADLLAGLAAYATGDWAATVASLGAWAAKPGADTDPGAARGLYALAYAHRSTGNAAASEATLARALPLLTARTASAPTLEAWYYLQGLHQMRGDAAAQMQAVGSAIAALEGGLCATRDGDDWFRIGRLHGFAGNAAGRSEAMLSASAAYEALPGEAPASPYRAMVAKELGEAALTSNDLESAEKHFALAAKLDPSIPGVHRQLGLVYLRRGNVEAASTHWRKNWKREREGGNAFMYAIPVMNRILAYRQDPALQPMPGLSQYSVTALEDAARSEAAAYLALRAQAEEQGEAFPAEKAQEMRAADYRTLQYLLEYVTRGEDLQEFALQNGMLPVIHARGMPSRPSSAP